MHELQTFAGVAKVPQVGLTMEEAVALAMHIGVTAGLMHSGRRWNSRDEITELGFAIMENADPLADVKKFAAENAGLLMLGKIFGLQRATNNASQISASHVVAFGSLRLSLGATFWVIPGRK